jgi:hypothetical protein
MDGEPFGFPTSEALWLTVKRLREILIWTSPLLSLGYVWALGTVIAKGRVSFTDWIMPLTLLFFLFYFGEGGNQYGPRYYYEAWPFALLTTLKALDPMLSDSAKTNTARWISAAIVASLLFHVALLPGRLAREGRIVEERLAVYNQVKKAGLKNAIVIIASEVGTLRPMTPTDLLRNGLDVESREVIYAQDLGERNSELASQFPRRRIYYYSETAGVGTFSSR